MAKIIYKFGRLLRNHPKKSIVLAGILAYTGNFANNRYEENLMMRAYCQEALTYGHMPHVPAEERHVTVILNPAANGGKGKSRFETYCEPLLHLAGLKVAIVRTEHEGEAKKLMEVMEKTNVVVAAGGDGTLSEIITGLLRRPDFESAVKRFPIGIIPIGESNNAAATFFGFEPNKKPEVKHLVEATMAIVREVTTKLDVMEITPMDDNEESPAKPIYAAAEFDWGAFRDAKERRSVYWYWPYLKKYMTYVFSSYKDISWNCAADMEYTFPCSGCRCCKKEEKAAEKLIDNKPKRWWHAFEPRKKEPIANSKPKIDYSNIINSNCGKRFQMVLDNIPDVRISTNNTWSNEYLPGYALKVQLGLKDISTYEFIQQGWQRERENEKPHFDEKLCGEIVLKPKELTLKDKKGNDRKYSIDNDEYEVKAVKFRAIPQAVTIYAPPKPTL